MRISRTSFRVLKDGHYAASLLLLGAGLLHAGPITYTFSGTGTGTLGSTSFTNANFVATIDGDTSNVGFLDELGALGADSGLSANIDITGPGLLNFTGTAFIFTSGQFVGFGESDGPFPSPPGDLFEIENSSVAGYNLTSDLTASGTNLNLSQFQNVDTDGGLLSFNSMSSVTFESEVASEPGSIFMLAAAFGVMPFLMRMRSKSHSGCWR